jgi:hypothetical protein
MPGKIYSDRAEEEQIDVVELRRRYRISRERRSVRSRSKLDDFRSILLQARKNGASWRELAFYLKTRRGIDCSPTTVMRFVRKWESSDPSARKPGK